MNNLAVIWRPVAQSNGSFADTVFMRIILCLLLIHVFANLIYAQEIEIKNSPAIENADVRESLKSEIGEEFSASIEFPPIEKKDTPPHAKLIATRKSGSSDKTVQAPYVDFTSAEKFDRFEKDPANEPIRPLKDEDFREDFSLQNGKDRFHWKPAIANSLTFLGIQHGFRLLQKKTTDELSGPFFRDWGSSVRNLGKWRDGDTFVTNYLGHPMQGAVTGWIFIQHSDKSIKQEFGNSREYWESRFKAMAWSAVWSAQFELGPISEASIGNVGLYDRVGPNTMGWVDMVITPTLGTGIIVLEDIIDKYIIKDWLEKKLTSLKQIKVYRTFFNPFQSFTNVLRGKKPWRRKNR